MGVLELLFNKKKKGTAPTKNTIRTRYNNELESTKKQSVKER